MYASTGSAVEEMRRSLLKNSRRLPQEAHSGMRSVWVTADIASPRPKLPLVAPERGVVVIFENVAPLCSTVPHLSEYRKKYGCVCMRVLLRTVTPAAK